MATDREGRAASAGMLAVANLFQGQHAGGRTLHAVAVELIVLIGQDLSAALRAQADVVAPYGRVAEVHERICTERPDAGPAVEGRCAAVDDDAGPRGVGD